MYTPPTTQTTGTLITASIWNTDIVDNITALWPYTTKGDIAAATGATGLARVASGGDGWGPVWYSPAASGVAASPTGLTLISAPYVMYENTSDLQTPATFTIPGGWMTTDATLKHESAFLIKNTKGSEGAFVITHSYATAARTNQPTTNYYTIPNGTSDMVVRFTTYVSALGGASQIVYGAVGASNESATFGDNAINPAYGTVDSTTDQAASITVQMDASSTNFQVTCLMGRITYMSAGTMTT